MFGVKVLFISLILMGIADAEEYRSVAELNAFQHLHPCPSTGLTHPLCYKTASGHRTCHRCPGYVIDHIKSLFCGGPDIPSNMQWQTIADGKAKDRWENRCEN
jgi:hypothetical protein